MRLEHKVAISLNRTFNSKILWICMDSPVLILVIVALFLAFTVESQRIVDPQPRSPSPPLPPPPLPPPSPVSPPPPPPRKPPASAVEGNHQLNKHLNSPPVKEKTNLGKKIGLVFVGVVSVWQVCIVAFLLISRRQLLKTPNGYQRN